MFSHLDLIATQFNLCRVELRRYDNFSMIKAFIVNALGSYHSILQLNFQNLMSPNTISEKNKQISTKSVNGNPDLIYKENNRKYCPQDVDYQLHS